MTRRLLLEGVENFRDYGDYPTTGGRRIKRGRLYRSAGHGRATPEDLEAIAKLDIAVVVDLRRKGERLRDPSKRHPSFRGQVILNDTGEDDEDSWHAHIRRSDLSEAAFRDFLLDYYRRAPFEARHVDLFTRYFAALAEADGPVLIHCAAGKDRTGILAALTHHLAGVHPSDTLADYLLTNQSVRMELRGPVFAQAIEALAGRAPSAAALRVAMGVDAAYLEAAFAAIGERCGGTDAYLEQILGVDSNRRAALHARLLD